MSDRAFWLRLLITTGAVALLIAQFVMPQLKLDAASLGLVALAVLPWLSSILESAKLPGGWEVKFRAVETEQARQREEIETLRFLIENFVSEFELVHLKKLASEAPFPFQRSDSFEGELRRLLASGFIERRPGRGIRSLFAAGDDVRAHLAISERGRAYLRHREEAGRLEG